MKQLFADIPDEDRRQISKLSIKLAQITEEKSKLQTQVVGLSQQNAQMQRDIDCNRVELEKQQEEVKKQANTIRSLHSKVDHYKAYIEDSKNEAKALMKENEDKVREVAELKRFLPEYEQIER